ncbi:site-2 protease family protein [Halobacillus sp. A5]|uniref:site-2 protease family protein n=1 Tax=Halobacillus sp. A5 TaxID=2880263 RepID=UPI0020A61FAA|nr:site-2 protease family protein [Halobacillus sp. A5]MCP3026447.1 site-2 protease family protein [Halobacillus sp. A5]
MDFAFNFLIYMFILFPIVSIVHEFGHAFFAKLFSQKIEEISIGMGKVIFEKDLLSIKSAYFAFGWVTLNEDMEGKMTKFQTSLFLLGGIIFNLATAVILDIFTGYEFFYFRNYVDSFIFLSYLQVLNLLPVTLIHGESDGKQMISRVLKS